MRATRVLAATALVAAFTLALGGCTAAAPDSGPRAEASAPVAEELAGGLTVYAAASLKTAFDELAVRFEQQHPGVDVRPIVTDGSSTLATQIIEGAPADVFASADEASMGRVTGAALTTGAPELFASNTLVVVTPMGNPGGVTQLSDLADGGVSTVLCATEVPCGAASQRLLGAAGVDVTPSSIEQNVTAVLTKVAADEADAGIVYATDVVGRQDVTSFAPEGAGDIVNRYPIASLAGSGNPAVAAAFVAFITSPDAQATLEELGFGAP